MSKAVRLERKLLLQSVYAALFASLSGVIVGLLVHSQMILFDGLYSLISVALSLMSLIAAKFMNKKDYKRYPFGKAVVEPLVIIIKYAIIFILLLVSMIIAIQSILNGGREVELGYALIYSALGTLLCLVVYLQFKRHGKKTSSGLLIAEANQWLMDTWVSLGVLIAFIIISILRHFNLLLNYLNYVDPALVIIICLLFLRIPFKEIKISLKEILDMAPEEDLYNKLKALVKELEAQYQMDESILRVTKGRKTLWVEVDFVISDRSKIKTIQDQDLIREVISKKINDLASDQWLSVSFTSDRKWAI